MSAWQRCDRPLWRIFIPLEYIRVPRKNFIPVDAGIHNHRIMLDSGFLAERQKDSY
jgi:hypothetical protein